MNALLAQQFSQVKVIARNVGAVVVPGPNWQDPVPQFVPQLIAPLTSEHAKSPEVVLPAFGCGPHMSTTYDLGSPGGLALIIPIAKVEARMVAVRSRLTRSKRVFFMF